MSNDEFDDRTTVRSSPRTTVRARQPSRPRSVKWVGASLKALHAADPRLAAKLGLDLFTRPRRFDRPKREESMLYTADSLRIPFGLGHLRGWAWGEGPTVLLVHGWEGRGTQLGAFVSPLVRGGYRVVAFDGPAHGATHGVRSSLPRHAEAVQAVRRSVGPVDAIVAHSFGGAASLYALRGGLDVQTLALVAPPDPSKALERFGDFLGLPKAMSAHMEDRAAEVWGAPLSSLAGPALAAGHAGRLLVVHDRDDHFVPHEDGRAIAAAWAGSELVTTEKLGHHRILRDPGVVRRVTDFVRG